MTVMRSEKSSAARQKRIDLRETIWPGSTAWVWDWKGDESIKGFATIPRLLPMVLLLIRHLTRKSGKGGDPASVYLELWSRSDSEGIVSLNDEQECAYCAGYTSNRAHRTWSEHMYKLVELGFILAKREGNRDYGQVLLLNPLAVCARLHAAREVPEEWWTLFRRKAGEMKATIPPPLILTSSPAPVTTTP
jgi:hypothetical protein